MPWLACLFVNESHRNNGIAGQLLDHGLQESKRKGFDELYLATDLEDFYESKGWKHITNGFNIDDSVIKIYSRNAK